MTVITWQPGQSTPSTQSNSPGVVNWIPQPAKVTSPSTIKVGQTPPGGFKIGDIFNAGQTAIKAVKDFTIKYLPEQYKQAKALGLDPLNEKADTSKVWSTYLDDLDKSTGQAGLSLRKVFTEPTVSKKVGPLGSTIAQTGGAIGALLFPTHALENWKGNPGQVANIGSISKALDIAFETLGEGGKAVGYKIVDTLHNNKWLNDQQAKDVREGVGDVGSLVAQLLVFAKAGKRLEVDPIKAGEIIQKHGPVDGAVIITKAKQIVTKKTNELTPGKTHTPEEVTNHVINSGIQDTPEGKNLLKTAAQAQKQGVNVTIEKTIG